ncbi:hypothetical protein AXF42_Ash001091 [Apostasia shenzhenica]|uniref:Uncharacterized protein n=1 Tax=Apostasia shenzhenica TaxID=1088818 RepID=A0A2I0ATX1_9ASPA|nr:hypothetical protein AXF42_Ash001091 [Apostasia shenzhenica]
MRGTCEACAVIPMELAVILRIHSSRWRWLGPCRTNPTLFYGRRIYFSKRPGKEMLLLAGLLWPPIAPGLIPSSANHRGRCFFTTMFPLPLILDSGNIRRGSLSVLQQYEMASPSNQL